MCTNLLLWVAVYVGKNKTKKIVSRVSSYVDDTQGIFFLDIFMELKPTFALFKEKIHKYFESYFFRFILLHTSNLYMRCMREFIVLCFSF